MTIEQALKIKQNWTAEQARNDLERLLLRDERPADKVIALACKALEKQIPRKVILGDDEQESIYCPVCGFGFGFAFAAVDDPENESTFNNYCPCCSQKLDWSDTK